MKIEEIIKPEYVEQPVAGIARRRSFRDLRFKPFTGSYEQWEKYLKDRYPDGTVEQDYDKTLYYENDYKKIAKFDPGTGQGTIPEPTSVIGQGAFAAVQRTADPFVVRKKSKDPTSIDDPYLRYINIIRNYMGQNPFLPITYRVTMQKGQTTANQRANYDLENLFPVSKFGFEFLSRYAVHLFPRLEPLIAVIDSKKDDEQTKIYKLALNLEFQLESLGNQILVNVRDEKRNYLANTQELNLKEFLPNLINSLKSKFNTYDSKLIEALTLISWVITEIKNASFDLHSENFMFRLLKGMPQLVFTDPIKVG
jgi:hypothetical protein